MRVVLLMALASIAGCGRSPASLGITGPGAPPPAVAPVPDDSTITAPGIVDQGSYGPSYGPIPSSGRYYNYN